MKKYLIVGLMLHVVAASAQVKTQVTEFSLSGPYPVAAPLALDTVDVKGDKFDEKSLLGGISPLFSRHWQVHR